MIRNALAVRNNEAQDLGKFVPTLRPCPYNPGGGVLFWGPFGLKTGIDFVYFGLGFQGNYGRV